eukprot:gene16380-22581_t
MRPLCPSALWLHGWSAAEESATFPSSALGFGSKGVDYATKTDKWRYRSSTLDPLDAAAFLGAGVKKEGALTRLDLSHIASSHPALREEMAMLQRGNALQLIQSLLDDKVKEEGGNRLDAQELSSLLALPVAADRLFDAELQRRLATQLQSSTRPAQAGNMQPPSASSSMPSMLIPARKAGEKIRRPPSDQYAPPPDAETFRSILKRSLQQKLRRAGYFKKDPSLASSLEVLLPKVLVELATDCGIPIGTHIQLARQLADIVSDQSPSTSGSAADAAMDAAQKAALAAQESENAESPSTSGSEASTSQQSALNDEEVDFGLSKEELMRRAMGDERRLEVLTKVELHKRILRKVVNPRQHVVVIEEKRQSKDMLRHRNATSEEDTELAAPSGPQAPQSRMFTILATGLSQRHVYACAEAVRYQLKQLIDAEVELERLSQQSPSSDFGSHDVPRPELIGPKAGDWTHPHPPTQQYAGRVVVQVLTEDAREYYNLESMWDNSSAVMQLIQPSVDDDKGVPLTLDTIRVEEPASDTNTPYMLSSELEQAVRLGSETEAQRSSAEQRRSPRKPAEQSRTESEAQGSASTLEGHAWTSTDGVAEPEDGSLGLKGSYSRSHGGGQSSGWKGSYSQPRGGGQVAEPSWGSSSKRDDEGDSSWLDPSPPEAEATVEKRGPGLFSEADPK